MIVNWELSSCVWPRKAKSKRATEVMTTRHGTTTLFTMLGVATGKCYNRPACHFLAFLCFTGVICECNECQFSLVLPSLMLPLYHFRCTVL